ncbi:hypothetical protein GCM10010449_05410 [Streptomyces rectiviolaceus]|uniref:Transposase IS701-like DDE domain-containing protein n=1 Tax=Streptomyces rectiviolaceus TaxID=332591 RepID=A0ABP6M745_9ACTN
MPPWLRSGAPCSAERLFCHVYGLAKSASQFIPGWPYSFVTALEPGATSWTGILDVVRLGPEDDPTAVTADQLRAVVERLVAAGQWTPADPDITIVMDAGYDVTRLAWDLRDLPVELVGRIRSDRVLRLPKPPRIYDSKGGRPPKHGSEFRFAKPDTWPEPALTTATDTVNYGKAEARAWDRVHPRLTHRSAWLEHDGELPIVEGALVRLKVEYLSKDREAPPVWLWSSKTGAAPADVDLWWQVFFRRFDLEHTFRFGKQTLGWTTPKIRTPEAADRWTSLLAVAHTQLRLTPARVRRGFRNIRPYLLCPGPFSTTDRNRARTSPRFKKPASRRPLRRRQNRQTPRDPQNHRQARKILVDKEQA